MFALRLVVHRTGTSKCPWALIIRSGAWPTSSERKLAWGTIDLDELGEDAVDPIAVLAAALKAAERRRSG